MGQRLVVTIKDGNERLCNIYYHWSAYTISALHQTKELINCIYNHEDETKEELLLRLIRFCENDGGGISDGPNGEEWKYIQKLYPNEIFKVDEISRCDGLISLSEREMNKSQSWSEGDVHININEDMVHFNVYSYYDNIEDYIREQQEWDEEYEGIHIEDIPSIDYDLSYFAISDIDAIIEDLYEKGSPVRYGNDIFEFIE